MRLIFSLFLTLFSCWGREERILKNMQFPHFFWFSLSFSSNWQRIKNGDIIILSAIFSFFFMFPSHLFYNLRNKIKLLFFSFLPNLGGLNFIWDNFFPFKSFFLYQPRGEKVFLEAFYLQIFFFVSISFSHNKQVKMNDVVILSAIFSFFLCFLRIFFIIHARS